MDELIRKLMQGDRRALSRILSYVENQDERAFEILEKIFEKTKPHLSIGITGAAGAGKSTMIDQLTKRFRDQQQKVSILAVDPSSPFSGGAVLGDRVRMQRHYNDEGVFIRSIGSRGKSGGVSFATRALLQILNCYGSEVSIVETVGAGQSEVDIMNLVDTTVVILTPESGDSIQALKAGMLEIADVFVINKKDRSGADRVAHDIEMMLGLTELKSSWRPPIVLTSAQSGEGVDELVEKIAEHQAHLQREGLSLEVLFRKRQAYLKEMIQTRITAEVIALIESKSSWMQELKGPKEPNLYQMVRESVQSLLKS